MIVKIPLTANRKRVVSMLPATGSCWGFGVEVDLGAVVLVGTVVLVGAQVVPGMTVSHIGPNSPCALAGLDVKRITTINTDKNKIRRNTLNLL
jgi:hypothetical protein